MAALTSHTQVDPGNTGRVGPTEAALFLKKSGLSDGTLGKIWDMADPEGKGYLDKQHDTSSPLLIAGPPAVDSHWAVRPEEKGKFDGIFESLLPINGLLSGEKVKPVLMNSKLPLDVLGRVWDLSDIDKDGHLDRDEFAVAMHLVYRALEKEPVPSVLTPSLIPPSKRRKTAAALPGSVQVLPGAVPVLPASPPPRDSLRSTPSHGSMNSLNSAGSLSPKHSLKSAQQSANWVVPAGDRGRYDDFFLKTDVDLDGFVSGHEVKDIFMHSGLPQSILAHIWSLADTRQMGKLTREQFSLAMHLIQQKVSKGTDPPQVLTPDMIPPSERTTPGSSQSGYMTPVGSEIAALTEMRRDSASSVGSGEFTGIKELDDISQEIAQLQREKYVLDQDIREKEESIRQKTSEVQELQNDLDRETSSLQELEAQKQDAQDRLEEMDQQKAKLEDMLNDVRQKCHEESQMISSLQMQIHSQESDLQSQEEELSRAKAELNRLQQEETQLEQSIQAGKVQLETIIKSLQSTQDEINQARSKLSQLQDNQQEMCKNIEQYNNALNGTHGGSMTNLADMSEGVPERDNGGFGEVEDPFKANTPVFNNNVQELRTDPFQSEDPFKTDPFKGADPFKGNPFGGDPFKENDPFKTSPTEDFFRKPPKADPFASPDPFSKSATLSSKGFSEDPFRGKTDMPALPPKKNVPPRPKPPSDPFGTLDPFGSSAFGSSSGFADFSQMSKGFSEDPFRGKTDMPALPPKKNVPPRPKPPSGKSTPVNLPGSGDSSKSSDPFQPFGAEDSDPFQNKKGFGDPFSGKDPFAPSSSSKASKDSALGFADFSSVS
ncbi:UNVERIFIED_CONTAM: hypothetical protein FKN15_042513 [Acipenser sinensis]